MPTIGPRFDFVEGDTLSSITVVFLDDDSSQPVDLTGGSALINFRTIDDDGIFSILFTRSLNVIDPVHGTCTYQFDSGELVKGTLRVSAVATRFDGKTISTKSYTDFSVRGGV